MHRRSPHQRLLRHFFLQHGAPALASQASRKYHEHLDRPLEPLSPALEYEVRTNGGGSLPLDICRSGEAMAHTVDEKESACLLIVEVWNGLDCSRLEIEEMKNVVGWTSQVRLPASFLETTMLNPPPEKPARVVGRATKEEPQSRSKYCRA